eukprot:scaffold42383_cov62-Attheya_sp.AAC.4
MYLHFVKGRSPCTVAEPRAIARMTYIFQLSGLEPVLIMKPVKDTTTGSLPDIILIDFEVLLSLLY